MFKFFVFTSMVIMSTAASMIRGADDHRHRGSRNAMMGEEDGSDWGGGMMDHGYGTDPPSQWGDGGDHQMHQHHGGGMMGAEGSDWGDGDGGMMGGAGPGWGGDGGICGGAMLGLWGQNEDSYYTSLTCSTTTQEPACLPGPGGHHFEDHGFHHYYGNDSEANGTWVCRTLYNPITGNESTFNACIDTEYALTTDKCGCCDDTCPKSCTCACDLLDTTATKTGVLVLIPSRHNATVTFEICVLPERAISMVAHGPATCKTECT